MVRVKAGYCSKSTTCHKIKSTQYKTESRPSTLFTFAECKPLRSSIKPLNDKCVKRHRQLGKPPARPRSPPRPSPSPTCRSRRHASLRQPAVVGGPGPRPLPAWTARDGREGRGSSRDTARGMCVAQWNRREHALPAAAVAGRRGELPLNRGPAARRATAPTVPVRPHGQGGSSAGGAARWRRRRWACRASIRGVRHRNFARRADGGARGAVAAAAAVCAALEAARLCGLEGRCGASGHSPETPGLRGKRLAPRQ